ncbi:MAG: GFA family protein, partial [Comamonas sp.]
PRSDLCITHGEADIKSYASSASVQRQFCQHCGSSLFWSQTAGDHADWICIALGTLDSPFSALKQKHVHLDARPLWSHFCEPDWELGVEKVVLALCRRTGSYQNKSAPWGENCALEWPVESTARSGHLSTEQLKGNFDELGRNDSTV